MDNTELTDKQLNDIYTWVDQIPLSKPKKNISRDFSDGLMIAEVIKFFIPKIVATHNYPPSHNHKQKMTNWTTLNRKVFKILGFQLNTNQAENIVKAKTMAIEKFLFKLRIQIEGYLENPPQNRSKNRRNSFDKRSNYQQKFDRGRNNPSNEYMPQDTPVSSHYRAKNPVPPPAGFGQNNLKPRNDPPIGIRRPSPSLQRAGLSNLGGGEMGFIDDNRLAMDPKRYSKLSKGQLISQLKQKDAVVLDLRDTVEILELKIKKMEQLLHLKEGKIRAMKRANGM